MKSSLKNMENIMRCLNDALNLIRDYCRQHHKKYSRDTKIPYGIGVDLYLLKAESLFKNTIGVEPTFTFGEYHTVGDIYSQQAYLLDLILFGE